MNVTEAVTTRKTVRQFTDEPVSNETIRALLATASRSPSGGNVQPWIIHVVNGTAMSRFRTFIADRPLEAPEYEIYPPKLWEPYRTNRFTVGEQMYATIGVGRDDKAGRARQFAQNKDFFGAPATLFCFIDRKMGPPQWSDLGMFLQTFMLLAREANLHTCPQEFWSVYPQSVREFVGESDEHMLFCGVAIGHIDAGAPINSLASERMPLDEWATFID